MHIDIFGKQPDHKSAHFGLNFFSHIQQTHIACLLMTSNLHFTEDMILDIDDCGQL